MLDRTAGWLLGAACTALIVVLGSTQRVLPRCPAGMEPLGARCCGVGQHLDAVGRCVGAPTACGDGLDRREGGCVAPRRRVLVAAGQSSWRPPDETAGAGEIARTGAFAIDAYEVTWDAWGRCVAAQRCPSLPAGDPGQAVSGVTRDEARGFCRFAGGRLPTDAEWLRAAIGDVERRYPWGDPDALCLRAAFALDGRCARGATGPDTAGARPWGQTPSGIHDLAGNVGEWVDDGAPVGEVAVRGGSFRERDATALRPRWRRVVSDGSRHGWIGFRCVYDATAP